MASSTGNFVSRFAPQSYFFTTEGAFTQSAEQTFGPLSDSQYRVTTLLNFSSAAMAYAAFMGVALIQPQTGNDERVNLILRPFRQPIVGLNIKYFIYRGLLKSDFLTGTTVIEPSTDTSDLVNIANKSFTDFYHKFYPDESVPSFEAKFLGYDPANQLEATLISKLFFKRSETTGTDPNPAEDPAAAFELPLVQQGASLGRFAQGEGGLDIVLSYGDYELPQPNDEFVFNLTYARAANWVIDLNGVSGDFKKKQTKEHIFQFLDSAAYYGFHAIDDGWVKVKSGGNDVMKKGDQIYNELLQSFVTKNTFYLYIQSDRTRSYNFYDNYRIGNSGTTSLRYGTLEANMTEREYATNGWPVVIDNSFQSSGDGLNRRYLQLTTDNNDGIALYAQIGRIEMASGNGFISADDLKIAPVANVAPVNLTKTIILLSTATTTVPAAISAFQYLVYTGAVYSYRFNFTDDTPDESVMIGSAKQYPDDLFGKVGALNYLNTAAGTNYEVTDDKQIRVFSFIEEKVQFGIVASQSQCIKDTLETGDTQTPVVQRVTYTSQTIDALNNVITAKNRLTQQTTVQQSSQKNPSGVFKPTQSFFFDFIHFTESGEDINGLQLKNQGEGLIDRFLIGLTSAEHDRLVTVSNTGALNNARFVLSASGENSTTFISQEGRSYQKLQLDILAEGADGTLRRYMPEEYVYVYTIDGRCFFSKEYSRFIKDNPATTLVLDLNIAL